MAMTLFPSFSFSDFCSLSLYLPRPGRGTEYCDEHASVCLSVSPRAYLRNHILKLQEILCACKRGCSSDSFLFWWQRDTLCSSDFVDDVLFARNSQDRIGDAKRRYDTVLLLFNMRLKAGVSQHNLPSTARKKLKNAKKEKKTKIKMNMLRSIAYPKWLKRGQKGSDLCILNLTHQGQHQTAGGVRFLWLRCFLWRRFDLGALNPCRSGSSYWTMATPVAQPRW